MKTTALVMVLVLSGCGLFTAGGVMSAVTQVISELTQMAKDRGHGELSQYPIECISESVPASDGRPAELLMLCTVTLEKPNG